MNPPSVPRVRKYAAILLVGFITLGADNCSYSLGEIFGCSDPSEPPIGDPPVCAIEPTILDFGSVAVGDQVERTVIVSNGGSPHAAAMRVWVGESFECPGITISTGPTGWDFGYELFAGDSGVFTFTHGPTEPGVLGCAVPFEATAVGAYHSVEDCPLVALYGEAMSSKPTCEVEPITIDFGSLAVGLRVDTAVEITNGNPFATDLYAQVDPSFACPGVEYNAAVLTVPGERTVPLAVAYTPPDASAMRCTLAILGSSDTEDVDCPGVDLSGEGATGLWIDCGSTLNYNDLRGVYGVTGDEVYAVGDAGLLVKHTGSCQWTDLETGADTVDLVGIWVAAEDTSSAPDFWLVGNDSIPDQYLNMGTLLSSDDAAAWTLESYSSFYDFRAVWGSGECDVYIVGMGVSTDFPNARHYTCDAGLTDLTIDLGMSEVTGVSGSGPDNVWAVLRQISYQVYTGSGTSWAVATESWMDQPLHDVWVTASGEVWAVGEQGAIYHRDGGGWIDESVDGETRTFYGVWAADTGEVFAVGEGGMIYGYDGAQWAEISSGVSNALFDVWGASATDVFAVGANGTILRSTVP